MEMNLAPSAASPAWRADAAVVDPDTGLVRAAQKDAREFVALYERYFERVFGYVCLRVAERETCEDLTSQVFTSALAKLSSFRGRGPFAAWLFQIARNA